ncbi:unnamed protein product, partial [Scytosiphon promiscuus]
HRRCEPISSDLRARCAHSYPVLPRSTKSSNTGQLEHRIQVLGDLPGTQRRCVRADMSGSSKEAKPDGCLQKISHGIESGMTNFFSRLGELVALNPGRTVLLALVGVVIGLSGVTTLETESRGDKLWVPDTSRAQDDYATYLSYFPKDGRENLVIAVPSDGGSDALSKDNLVRALELFQQVSSIAITYEGVEYSFEDLCVESAEFTGTPCSVESVLGKWQYEADLLDAETDATILDTINTGSTVSELENFLGGITLSDDGSEVVSAEALRMVFLLENTETVKNGEYFDPIPDEWELEFIDVAQECVDGLECFVEATRSLSDEFGSAISGDISLISGSYMIILAYTIFNLSSTPFLKSRIILSLGAILTVGLSIGFSIGLAAYLGFFYTPLHTVLPFILLGLGVDDSFVICNSFGRTDPRKSIPERMREGLGHAGVSITVTSITDIVAFLISATTVLPALSSFCVYSALGVLALYILQARERQITTRSIAFSTLFVAFVVYDTRRQEAGRLDCCCCFKTKNMEKRPSALTAANIGSGEWDPAMGERGRLEKFAANTYAPLLTKKPIKAAVIVIFGAIFAICCYGATKLGVDDTDEAFIPDGSYLLETNEAIDQYFGGVGADVEIVTEDIDYFSMQAELADVSAKLTGFGDTKSPYIQDPATSGTFFSWFDDLIVYAEAEGVATLVPSTSFDGEYTVFSDEGEFQSTLEAFLASPDGLPYTSSVIVEDDGTIRAAAILSEYSGAINGDAAKQVDAMVDLRDLMDEWNFEAFPWSSAYFDWENFQIIYKELFQGLGLCVAAVFLLTLILLAHPLTAGLVFLMVTFTIVDVLGIMYFWGLSIDTIAVINLVLAVGLSVDYSAHIAHSFMIKTGTRDERVMQAVSDIGVAVVHGGMSTFLAVVLLSLSASYVFRVLFKQFFATAVMGLGHGLILLPVLLSLIGPAAYRSSETAAEDKEIQAAVTTAATNPSSKVSPSEGRS